MAHEILTTPVNISNLSTYTGLGVNNGGIVSLNSYSGNVILLSFINADTAYDWLSNLVSIKSSLTVEVIVVMFRHNGVDFQNIYSDDVISAINNAGLSDSDFSTIPVLIDNGGSWTNSYLQGILSDPDGVGFSGTFSIYDMLSYIISSDYLITDKWHTECSANGDPISLNRISPPGTFVSSDFANTETFVTQRINNLNAPPTILYTVPAESPPSISNISEIQPIELVYSKPVVAAADTDANYTPGGAGGGALTVAASYTGADKIENMATLTIGGSISDGDIIITLGAPITDTAGNPLTSNTVTYNADVSANPVASITSDISGTTGTSPIPVTITFSKEVVGFNAGDITTANCTVTNFIEVTSQRVWTADIMPNSQGEFSLYIDQDAVQDTSGNGNLKTQTLYITYTGAAIDIDAPRVLSVKINPHLDQ